MKALVIAATNLTRTIRDRMGLLFVFFLPIVIIVALGLQFGSAGAPRVGLVAPAGQPLVDELVDSLGSGELKVEFRRYGTEAELLDAVERGLVQAGIVVPSAYEAALRSGGAASVRYVAPPTTIAMALRPAIDTAVADQAAIVRAARFAEVEGAGAFAANLDVARRVAAAVPGVEVVVTSVGEPVISPALTGFTLGAQSQLVLFVFLTSMTAATQLIVSRQLGVSRRMLATPTGIRTILLGEALGRFGVAMLQGLFIVFATAFAFGVDWGDPLAAGALVVAYALVGTGAAMLVGAVATNAEQAGSFGVFLALGLGALGGAMVPLEVFPPFMRQVAHLTPHAWAIDGFRELVVGRGGVADVLPQLGVLLGFAGVLLGLAIWRFRRALAG